MRLCWVYLCTGEAHVAPMRHSQGRGAIHGTYRAAGVVTRIGCLLHSLIQTFAQPPILFDRPKNNVFQREYLTQEPRPLTQQQAAKLAKKTTTTTSTPKRKAISKHSIKKHHVGPIDLLNRTA